MTSRRLAVADWIAQARGRLVIAAVLIAGLYFVVAFGEQAWKARQLQGEVAERQAAIATLQSRHDALSQQLDEYSSSDRYLAYAERIARRDLNLSHPGETVLLVRWQAPPPPTPQAPAGAASASSQEPNWRHWLELFGLK
jgi:cell division protein FtsB